jgi:hypothetical protein
MSAILLCGCEIYKTRVDDAPGKETIYEDTATPGSIQGIGIESQDIVSMTDRMMREILSVPQIAGRDKPPLVAIDDKKFENRSASRLDKKLIVNRLRVELNRKAQGRMYFVTPERADADFSLNGSIASLDTKAQTGMTGRYHQITFELVDNMGLIVWSGMYEFRKSAQDDVIYR